MHIRFLRDFRGVNTNEQFFTAGTVIDHPNGQAIVDEGAAEAYTVEARKGQVKVDEDAKHDEKSVKHAERR